MKKIAELLSSHAATKIICFCCYFFKKSPIFILTYLLIATSAFAKEIEQDTKGWSTKVIHSKLIQLSVHGQVVHGDIFSIFLRKENCEFGIAQSYLYTIRSEKAIKQKLENKFIYATFIGNKVRLNVSYVFPVLGAHVAVIDMGVVKLDEVEQLLLSKGEIAISYDALDGLDIEQYFDIRKNIWSTHNLSQAFKEAKLMCQKP